MTFFHTASYDEILLVIPAMVPNFTSNKADNAGIGNAP